MNFISPKLMAATIAILVVGLLSFQLSAQEVQQRPSKYKFHSFGLKVSDVEASLSFYQSLFDAPVLYREGTTVYLGLGDTGEFASLSPLERGEAPAITYIGIVVNDFDIRSMEERLTASGLKESMDSADMRIGLKAAMTYWHVDADEQEAITLSDYEGVQFQLLSENYCVDHSKMPGDCKLENKSNKNAPMSLLGINHFTTFVANFERANAFYRSLLGIENHMFQGNFPTLGVGDGYQFLMFVGGAQQGAPAAAANIHHVSLAVENFDVEKIQSILNSKGLKFVGSGNGVVPPLSHYVSLRMPERGGAEGGTPELYFTDPDGLRIQLQDASYCGGGGYLGNECKN
ncbi:hypothetical protein NBRC116493_17310 [Aurantivibrio infirmus]